MRNSSNNDNHSHSDFSWIKNEHSSALERFYQQLLSFPKLLERALMIDQTLLLYFEEMQANINTIWQELNQQQENWLKDIDQSLLPIAREVIKDQLREVLELKLSLEETIQSLQKTAKKDWIEHVQAWVRLRAKMQNRQAIMEDILDRLATKQQKLIDRDIKIIQDYQDQSLSHLSKKSKEFKATEQRLKVVTSDALNHLNGLKESTKELSLNQVSEWISNLQSKRESYFDQVLMKIDTIVKDVGYLDNKDDSPEMGEMYHEMEDEIAFMEKELHHINEVIPKLDLQDEKDVNFIEVRLEGLKEHLNQLNNTSFPQIIKKKIEKLYNMIAVSYFRIKGV